jgi:hypothetical protein
MTILFQLWLAASLAFGAVWALAGMHLGEGPALPADEEAPLLGLGLDGLAD